MNKSVRPKKYKVTQRGLGPNRPYWEYYEYVISNGDRVNGGTARLRHTFDWSWVAFLIYAKAKGWKVEEA